MEFYRLTHPNYETDSAHSRENPVEWANEYILPGVICPICGPWSGRRRLFMPIEDPKLKKRLMQPPFPIPFDEWKKLVDNISESAGTVSDRYLIPGDELGEPTAKITNSHVSDFVFPWRGGILVTEKTRRIIEGTKLSGYKLVKIVLINSKRNKFLNLPLPALYVLIVTGRIKPPQKVDRCYVCGRFKANYSIELSEGKWDGNDFIIDENYPDLIFVTERVCTVFKENGLQNYMCKPI